MVGKSPTWADQWEAGPFNNEEDYEKPMTNKTKKMEQVKAVASTGLKKAKTATVFGAKKIKIGTSSSFKWLKNKCSSK